MSKKLNVAVVGATGAVGESFLEILASRQFPVDKLHALASGREPGRTVVFGKKNIDVEDLSTFDFKTVDLAFFSAGGKVSAEYVPIALAAGCRVIDNTSVFRMNKDVPLVVPEVNAGILNKETKFVSNPNCSTIQLVVALKPLQDKYGIERVNVSTYQAVSGTGRQAIDELAKQAVDLFNGLPIESAVYPQQIAFNVLPHIDSFESNGYTREEMKIINETPKILGLKELDVTATAVRVPVFYGHSLAVTVELHKNFELAELRETLKNAPGIILMDEAESNGYPTPLLQGSGTDAVYVGRVRRDISHPQAVVLWIVADNVRKGGALNSIQIAECFLEHA